MTRPPCGPGERLVELQTRLVDLRLRLVALQVGAAVSHDDVLRAEANLLLAVSRAHEAQARAGDAAVAWATRTRP